MDNLDLLTAFETVENTFPCRSIKEDKDDNIVVVAAVLHLLAAKKKKWHSEWSCHRLDWDEHVGMMHNESGRSETIKKKSDEVKLSR